MFPKQMCLRLNFSIGATFIICVYIQHTHQINMDDSHVACVPTIDIFYTVVTAVIAVTAVTGRVRRARDLESTGE